MRASHMKLATGVALLAIAVGALALRLPPSTHLYEGLAVFAVLAMGSALPRWDKIDPSSISSLSVLSRWLLAIPVVLLLLATAALAGLAMGFGLQGTLIMVAGSIVVAIFLYVLTRLQRRV